jgi:signal transduction histidine kinase
MTPEVMKNIFHPFYTTKPVGVGTGLGLAIAYKIITDGHGGRLEVASTLGVGSTFMIWLPKERNL